MSGPLCLFDFSSPEIQAGLLVQDEETRSWQHKPLRLDLPWEVGFQQQEDGSLLACFGEAFQQLNSSDPNEVRFPELDARLKDITDEQTLRCLFRAFLAEIFEQRFPKFNGIEVPRGSNVYVITPHHWLTKHRAQLRETLKQDFPYLKLRGCLSGVFCAAFHCFFGEGKTTAWAEAVAEDKLHEVFLFDFREDELTVWKLRCGYILGEWRFHLCDVKCYPDYLATGIQSTVQNLCDFIGSPDTLAHPPAFGGWGIGERDRQAIVERVLEHYRDSWAAEIIHKFVSIELFAPHYGVTLDGAASLVRLFQEKNAETQCSFSYQFAFGVRLPSGNWVEIIPKDEVPPVTRRRAFRIIGEPEPLYVELYCGLSLSDESYATRLGAFLVEPDSLGEPKRSPEFIVSVDLYDYTRGRFTVLWSDQRETLSLEFAVPVLMD